MDEPFLSVFGQCKDIDDFSEEELDSFDFYAVFIMPNPRKIKRITNIYRGVRLLIPSKHPSMDEANISRFRAKLLKWLILLEQWPVRMSWLLQFLEDYEQTQQWGKQNKKIELDYMSLFEVYRDYVEDRVFDTALSRCPPSLITAYQDLFELDGDPETFDKLLEDERDLLKVNDVGGFSERSKWKLISYTICLNPAIRATLTAIAGINDCYY